MNQQNGTYLLAHDLLLLNGLFAEGLRHVQMLLSQFFDFIL